MELSQVTERFNDTPISGWNSTTSSWDDDIVSGKLVVFDRFISDRSFGQRKRNFIVGGGLSIPAGYEIIRFPNQQTYLVEDYNVDQNGGGAYSTIYLLHEAPFQAQVMQMVTTPRANGAPGSPTPTAVATTYVDLDRYAFLGAEDFESVRFGVYTVVLPASVTITTEMWLTINGVEYDVREKSVQLDLTYLRVVARTA